MARRRAIQPIQLGVMIWRQYGQCGVSQAAAAMSYSLILTIFPLLLCINYLIGLFQIDLEQLLCSLHQILPNAVLDLLLEYLKYAGHDWAAGVPMAALTTIILSASAGLRILLNSLDRIYGQKPVRGIKRFGESVVLSILVVLILYLSIIIIFTGEWFFLMLEGLLPRLLAELLPLQTLSSVWAGLRYILLFASMLLLVLMIYWIGTPRELRGRGLLLSAILTAGALVCGSVIFSGFISLSSRYSIVYGSLASLMILLVWLYVCGNVLLLGALIGRILFQR